MAIQDLGSRYNLVSMLKLVDPQNRFIDFAEVLTEENPLLMDIPFLTANGVTTHSDARETSLPTPQVVGVGEGHDASVVEWDNFTETISRFVDRVDIPKSVFDLQPDKAAYRRKIENRHAEGFGQGVCNHMIYGSSAADPKKFDGLGVRYSVPDNTNPANPSSASADFGVFDAGGTGSDTCSIWLLQPSPDKLFAITPPNDPNYGLQMDDMGDKIYINDANSKQMRVLRTELEWKLGWCVRDLRACARIRNIESAITNVSQDLVRLIYQARNEIFRGSEPVFMYIPRRLMTHFQIMAEAKQNVLYDRNNIYDVPMYRWGDMGIRVMDALTITEDAVAGV